MTVSSGLALPTVDLGYLLKVCLQIGLLLLGLWVIYRRFIEKSYVEHLVRGLFVVLTVFAGFWAVAKALNLTLLEGFFALSVELLMFGLMVVFQPEIRRIFLYVGQVERTGKPFQTPLADANYLIREVLEAIRFLRKTRQGALIVLENAEAASGNYLETGTPLDALLSTELLLTIFHPKTPLHDGAVVINEHGRVVAAGVLLPLTEDPKLSWQLGTRHRAAIGLSEVTDNYCLVLSEETGNVSIAYQGQLEKLATLESLEVKLSEIMGQNAPINTQGRKQRGLSDLWRPERHLNEVLRQLRNHITG